MYCNWKHLGDGRPQCIVCGWTYPDQYEDLSRLVRVCNGVATQRTMQLTGNVMHKVILKIFGETTTFDCGCESKIYEMNNLGPSGCREHIDDYVSYLSEKANKQNWFTKQPEKTGLQLRWWKIANKASQLTGTQNAAIKQLIIHAIRKTEKEIIYNLKETFDRVVVVNMKRRADRLEQFNSEIAKDWPFKNPETFDAVEGDRLPLPKPWKQGGGAFGCMQSHRHILEKAILDGVDRLLVLEDDVVLSEGFTKKITKFLIDVPGDWDQLMIGGQHIENPHDVRSGVVRCMNCQRTHAYAIRGGFMRALYQKWMGSYTHCDHVMGPMQKDWHVYAPDPFLCGQAKGQSDINGRENPTKFWVPPDDERPIVLLHCPQSTMEELRTIGFHGGYQRDQATGIDTGLLDMFHMTKKKKYAEMSGPQQQLAKRLREWIEMIQWEVASEPQMVCTIWHPDATLELVQQATEWPICEVSGESVEEILSKLPAEIRNYIQPETVSV